MRPRETHEERAKKQYRQEADSLFEKIRDLTVIIKSALPDFDTLISLQNSMANESDLTNKEELFSQYTELLTKCETAFQAAGKAHEILAEEKRDIIFKVNPELEAAKKEVNFILANEKDINKFKKNVGDEIKNFHNFIGIITNLNRLMQQLEQFRKDIYTNFNKIEFIQNQVMYLVSEIELTKQQLSNINTITINKSIFEQLDSAKTQLESLPNSTSFLSQYCDFNIILPAWQAIKKVKNVCENKLGQFYGKSTSEKMVHEDNSSMSVINAKGSTFFRQSVNDSKMEESSSSDEEQSLLSDYDSHVIEMNAIERKNFFDMLDDYLLLNILLHLDIFELTKVSMTNKQMWKLVDYLTHTKNDEFDIPGFLSKMKDIKKQLQKEKNSISPFNIAIAKMQPKMMTSVSCCLDLLSATGALLAKFHFEPMYQSLSKDYMSIANGYLKTMELEKSMGFPTDETYKSYQENLATAEQMNESAENALLSAYILGGIAIFTTSLTALGLYAWKQRSRLDKSQARIDDLEQQRDAQITAYKQSRKK